MNLNDYPKVLVDQIAVTYNPNLFMLAIRNGKDGTVFCLDPEGAKAFAQNLAARIAEYEEKVKLIDASSRTVDIISPFQFPGK